MIEILFAVLTGTVKGKVTDAHGEPLTGVNVVILQTDKGASTDENGNFCISGIKVGRYTVEFSMLGYRTKRIPNVIITAQRPVFLEVKMHEEPIKIKGVTVKPDYFERDEEAPTSSHVLSYEEIRRTTGVAEDVSRMVQLFSGVQTPSDDRNDIVVRGGTPLENAFYVDGARIPNPNHFASMGSGGGPIGMLQTFFIKKAKIYTGGFPARYGDALSSAIVIEYRNGVKDKRLYIFDVSMAGAGMIFDGSVGNFSYLFSARRSFLDLMKLFGAIDISGIPEYYDIQSKITYRISPNHIISFLGIGGDSWIYITEFGAEEYEITNRSAQYTLCTRYRFLNNSNIFTLLLYETKNNYDVDVKEKEEKIYYNHSLEKEDNIAFTADIKGNLIDVTTGAEFSFVSFRHNIWVRNEFKEDKKENTYNTALFLQSFKRIDRFSISPGIRISYLEYNKNLSFSPRVSFSFEINPLLFFNFSTGIYTQHPEWIWFTANDDNKNLRDMKAYHFIAGIDYYLREDAMLKIETYEKIYRDYPVDKVDSARILLNEGASYEGFLNFHPMISEGKGYARGIDFELQKRFSDGFYGVLSYSFTKTGVVPLSGKEYPSIFEVPHALKIAGGIEVFKNFTIGFKWAFGYGRHYYPIDSLASAQAGYVVRDYSTIKEYPPYHRLDIRIEKREFHKKFNIVWYFEIDNVYARKNIREYYWDDVEKKIKVSYQWGFMPVGGTKIEF